jgi:hypothetical protein
MILRFCRKLAARLKTGTLKPLPLESAAEADWTSHLFFFDRTPYILVSRVMTAPREFIEITASRGMLFVLS